MPLGSSHPLEKDLEKRSLNGAYIYLPAWLLIGFASGYSGEQTVVFWEDVNLRKPRDPAT